MSEEIVAVDMLGREIRVGDQVLYPRMSGRSVEMSVAVVARIDEVPEGRRVRSDAYEEWLAITPWQDRPDWDQSVDQWQQIPAWKFSLRPFAGSRNFTRWSDKPVYISIGQNVVRVEA